MAKKQKLAVLGVVVGLGLYIFLGLLTESEPAKTTHTINLTEAGFVPPTITIAKDDTVVFATEREREFWPASNLHPAHAEYPEFDPNEPINPQATWEFTFTKSGEWGYHDHLHSFYKGLIIVE